MPLYWYNYDHGCPKCGSHNVTTALSDGTIRTCVDCGYTGLHAAGKAKKPAEPPRRPMSPDQFAELYREYLDQEASRKEVNACP